MAIVKRRLLAPLMLAGLVALAACAAQETIKEKAAAPAPAAAPAAPAPEAKPAWQQEWERVLAAAKREGKVAVFGPPGAEFRRAVTEPFERKYGVSVEYRGGRGEEELLRTERAAGQYRWDVFIGGTTTAITRLKPAGFLDPIEPALILPEVKDPKNWREGKLLFSEKDKVNLVMSPATRVALFVNPKLADPKEFKSFKDLLDPKWKGKILVGRDPRIGGPGQATFTLFYRHKDLGPDYIRALAKQDLTLLRDDRQAGEWLAQGRFPLALGIGSTTELDLRKAGADIRPIDPRQLKEGGDISPGPGSIALINKAAHPNAAKVYINWLLFKEGQTGLAKSSVYPSWRADVPPAEHQDPWAVPQPGYVDTYSEEAMAAKEPLLKLLRELFAE